MSEAIKPENVYHPIRCRHCGGDVEIRNPSGFCDHLHYPENCVTCSGGNNTIDRRRELKLMEKIYELERRNKTLLEAATSGCPIHGEGCLKCSVAADLEINLLEKQKKTLLEAAKKALSCLNDDDSSWSNAVQVELVKAIAEAGEK